MRNRLLIFLTFLLALPLAAEQKNVKLLTGLSDLQLQRVMNEMAAGLGVGCDFCHTRKDGELDFADESKKEKQRAREMIELTRSLNTASFNGRSTISCYTCHRGKEHPTGLVPLPVAAPARPGAGAEAHEAPKETPPANPAVADVVKRYADAVGDAGKWSSLRAKGTRESLDGKNPIPIEVEASGANVHVTATTPRGKSEQILGTTGGWMRGGQGAHALDANDLERMHESAALFMPLAPADIPKEGRVIGHEKIGEHDAWALFTTLGPKSRQRLYFDTTTGLLVRRVVLTDSPVGTIPQQTDYEDWRDAGGAKYPFTIRAALVDPWSSAARRYSEVTVGATVDPAVFAEPK
jgi:hypothetical protein